MRERGYLLMENEGAAELARKSYENLFTAICSNPQHLLAKLIPKHRNSGY